MVCGKPWRTMAMVAVATSTLLVRIGDATHLFASPASSSPLDGSWDGTETCVEHCDFLGPNGSFSPGHNQGVAPAGLVLAGGNGTYSIGETSVVSTEFHGYFAAGHIVGADGSPHGTFQMIANDTHLWGSWMTYGTKRLFRWDMARVPPACVNITNKQTCQSQASPDTPRCMWNASTSKCVSRVRQVDVFLGNTTAPWGTTYHCFRVPSVVRALNGDVLLFVESRIGSCNDQAPKDITMKVSHDGGVTWGPLTLVVGPKAHLPCAKNSTCLDFTARNPYATVTTSGEVVLFFTNSTNPSACVNYQLRLTQSSGWLPIGPQERMDMGPIEGVLAGPGEGIVLGRHSANSKWAGRMVGCGATGYVGGMKESMPIWTSDDNGTTYNQATGGSLPWAGIGECQIVELNNGSVMVNARNEIPGSANPMPKHRAYGISHDGGTTWSDIMFSEELIEPTCMAGLINADGVLYFSNPDSTTSRTHMTVKRSVDSGESWVVDTPIYADSSAYSALVPLVAGKIGCVYERDDYSKMTIAIIIV